MVHIPRMTIVVKGCLKGMCECNFCIGSVVHILRMNSMVNVTFILKECMSCTEDEQYHVARFVLKACVVDILRMDSVVNASFALKGSVVCTEDKQSHVATFVLKVCMVHALRMNSLVNATFS